ncbi:MAG: ABC-type transport auxiliary lipoprotein family protein [Gammaproteobacteria bacterium]
MKIVSALQYAFVGVLLLAGCSILPQQSSPPALHDFGPPANTAPNSTQAKGLVDEAVTSAAWLTDTAIYYRLLYDDPTRLRAYADNRWIAPPAELLQTRLQMVFNHAGANTEPPSGTARYRLHLELLDFEQVFDTPQSAHVSVHVEARLQDLVSGVTIAQHSFVITLATSPYVQGAVQGYARVTDQLLRQVVQWTAEELTGEARDPVQPRNTSGP